MKPKKSKTDEINRKILEFVKRYPQATVNTIAESVGLSRGSARIRVTRMNRKGILSRELRVINDPEEQVTYLVNLTPSQAPETTTVFANLPRLCWGHPKFRDRLRVLEVWETWGGTTNDRGNMVDGVTLLIKASDIKVVGEFQQFLAELDAVSSNRINLVRLFPVCSGEQAGK